MNLYMDKLNNFVPVVKHKQLMLAEQGPKVTFAKMDFLPDGDYYYKVPYLQKLEELGEGIVLDKEKRIFLVTEEDNIAIKTAYNYIIYPVYEMQEEIREEMSGHVTPDSRIILRNQDGADIKLRIISMHGEKASDTGQLQYRMLSAGVTEDSFVLYNGLEENSSLNYKLDII